MYKSGHMGLSLLLYSPVLYLLIYIEEILLASVGLLIVISYASVPDLDFKVPKVKHRGYSHSLLGALIIAIPVSLFTYISYTYIKLLATDLSFGVKYSPEVMGVYAFIIGFYAVLTHYAGDVVTPSGIPILAPVSKKKYSLNLFYAKNKLANGLSLVLGILATSLVIGYPIYQSIIN